MIRKQVENLRGYIFTMEEICDIIIPVLETSLCMMKRVEKPVYTEKPIDPEKVKGILEWT